MKAVIVDDEPDGVRTLRKMLEKHCPNITIAATCNDADSAKQEIYNSDPDLVFLDINMPGKNGFELLSEIKGKSFEIIFVTAHNEYLLKALQYSAADYLLKPVDEDRLTEAVERVETRLKSGKEERRTALMHNLSNITAPAEMRLCLPTMKGFIILKLDDIVYCEAERSYSLFHLQDGRTIMVSKPLSVYDVILQDTSFLRVHKSFLINLHHVKEYQRGEGGVVIMSNDAEIEISRRRKELFLLKVNQFYKH